MFVSSLKTSCTQLPLGSLLTGRESSWYLIRGISKNVDSKRHMKHVSGLSEIREKPKIELPCNVMVQMREMGALPAEVAYRVQDNTRENMESVSCTKKFIGNAIYDVVTVNWEDGKSGEFLSVWLRDNCKCPQCFHSESQGRSLPLRDLDIHIGIKSVEAVNGDIMVITWDTGHVTTFQSEWLKERMTTVTEERKEKTLWKNGFLEIMERFKYKDLMEDDWKLLMFLEQMDEFGISLIEEAPCEVGIVRSICSRVGFPKMTHYGDCFEVRSKSGPSNLAYTGSRLGLHLDQPYYKYSPGTQLLHCIKQHRGVGGDSQFVDGFAVANKIMREHPEEWNTLTKVPLTFFDEGVEYQQEDQMKRMSRNQESFDFIKARTTTTFRLDQGKMAQICFNNHSRSSWPVGDIDTVERMYRALKLFENICNDDEMMVQMKMRDGDIVIVDNMRVLHGRSEFSWEDGGDGRHVQGGYIDWDEIYSRINVIKKKLDNQPRYIDF